MKQEFNDEIDNRFFSLIKDELKQTVNDIEDYYKSNFNDKTQYLKTGFDKFCLRKGDLIILASRPCLGRFSFAMSIINNLALTKKKPVGFFTCGERDASSICKQLISIRTKIPLTKILQGRLNTEDVKKICKEAGNIYKSKIFINDSPNIMYEEFEIAARLMVQNFDVELIILDSYEYLQEIVNTEDDEIFFTHSKIIEQYKKTARELNIPIIILMELPNYNEEPSIADFKKNMVIPRIADEVYILNRDRIKNDRLTCDADLIMGKNAHGVNLYIPLTYHSDEGIYTNYMETEV